MRKWPGHFLTRRCNRPERIESVPYAGGKEERQKRNEEREKREKEEREREKEREARARILAAARRKNARLLIQSRVDTGQRRQRNKMSALGSGPK